MAEELRTDQAAGEGEMFRLLTENVLDYAVFVVDPRGRVLTWGKGAERLLGFTEQEIVGRQCDCFFTPEDVAAGVPQQELELALAAGRGGDDRWHQRKDGTRFWSSGTVTPLKDGGGRLRGYCKFMQDGTTLKRSRDALNDALAYAEAIVATVREPLVVLGGDLRVVTANRSFHDTFRVRPEDTHGELLFALGNRQWDIPALRTLLEEVLPRDAAFNDYEVEHDFPAVGRKVMLLNARKLRREGDQAELILLAIEDVTALRDAERQRQEAEARFTEMVKNVRDHSIFLTDPDGVITSWNVAAERITGYTGAEAVGRHFSIIFTPEDIEGGVPERELRLAREEGRAEDERWHVRKGGERFWALGIVTPLHDPGGRLSGFSKILRDMTERKWAEEQLAASRHGLQALFDHTLDAVLLADDRGRYVDANPAACSLLGLARDDLLRRTVFDVTPPADAGAGAALWNDFLRDGRQAGEYSLSRPDGSTAMVEYRAVANVQPGLHLSVLRDITGRREAEGRLRDIIDNWPAVVFAKDAGGRYLLANRACEAYSGEPAERMVGKTDYDYLPAEVADRFRADDRRVLDTGEALRYEESVPFGGELRTSLTVKFPLRDATGRPYAVCGIATDITDLKRAGEALREGEERLRTLSDNLPHGAVYQVLGDPEGRRQFTFISAGVERLLGVSPAEALADAASLYGLVHEDDRPRVAAAEEVALRDSAPFDCEFRSWTHSGGVVWVHARSAPRRLPTGPVVWEGVLMDVTARKYAEADLARLTAESDRQRRLYETALSNTVDFIYTFDLDGRFVYVNAALLALWGKRLDEAVGRNFFDLDYPPALADRLQRQIRQVIDTKQPLRDETPYTSGLGERMYEYIFAPVVGAGDAVEAVAGSTRDITARKVAEVERERLVGQLRDQDRRKDEFLATLAHELRNPLAPIRNGLQVIRLAGVNGTVEQARSMMERQLTQLVRLVDDLLDVSRVTSGKLELRTGRVELRAVIDAAVETSRPTIEQAGHDLAVVVPDEPIFVDGDHTRLAQVVCNLLNNSAKYTHRGGHVRLVVGREGGTAVVRVGDDGIGIPPAMLGRVFEMFTQVDRTLEKTTGGLGIGLSLVKGLVEMHGGTIEARSDGEGMGSEFVVRLPVVTSVTGGPDYPDAEAGVVVPSGRRRILVVDDNADSADSLGQLLELLGNEVRTANDGEAGVAAAAAFRPDVVLMDIGMPKVNGYDAARRIRAEPWGRDMVLVALTGWGQEDDRQKSADAGFDHHLVKPLDAAALQLLLEGSGRHAR